MPAFAVCMVVMEEVETQEGGQLSDLLSGGGRGEVTPLKFSNIISTSSYFLVLDSCWGVELI